MRTDTLPFMVSKGKCLLNAVTAVKPSFYCVRMDSRFSSPLGYRKSLALEGDVPIRPGIVVLCFSVSPSAIFRAVVSAIVDPVERGLLWAITHVSKKVFKIHPSITDLYPPAAIARVLRYRWIEASALHFAPGSVGPGFSLSRTVSVLYAVLGTKAATRFVYAPSERRGADNNTIAAITNAIPKRTPWRFFVSKVNDLKTFKLLTCQVNKCRHGFTSIMASNHWKVRNSGVIDVPFSAAKPSYAFGV